MSAHEVIVDAIEKHVKDHKQAIKIGNEVFTALDNGCWFTTDDDHLALLRSMRKRIADAVSDPDTAPRDLASLTRRLQDVSREATTLEEKQRQEGKGKTNGDTGSSVGTTTGTPLDPSTL